MRTYILLIIVFITHCIHVNAHNNWTDSSYRDSIFPKEVYYVAYDYRINENNNLDECISKAVTGVQSLLANSISSIVSSKASGATEILNQNGKIFESERFTNDFSIASSAHLVNVNIEHFYDNSSNIVHAIAYVKKQDLVYYCENRLKQGLSSLNEKLNSIHELSEKGLKSEANELVDVCLEDVKTYPLLISQLISIGIFSISAMDYTDTYEKIYKRLIQQKSILDHSIIIYMNSSCSSSLIKSDYLSGKCKGILSNNGFSISDDPASADYSVSINYTTRTSSYSDIGCFAFADISIVVERTRDHCIILDDLLSVKGGANLEEKAHLNAVDQSSKKLCDKILQSIIKPKL